MHYLHYRESGEHSSGGSPLLFLHGLFGSSSNWGRVVSHFASKHRCISHFINKLSLRVGIDWRSTPRCRTRMAGHRGVLAGAGQVYLHYGFDGWNPTIAPDPLMTWNPTTISSASMVISHHPPWP